MNCPGWECACISSDAYECMRLLYKESFLSKAPFDEDDYCECSCHSGDQDGINKWGDPVMQTEMSDYT